MKTPTLAQLKKRPALWFYIEEISDYVEPKITMPDETIWEYDEGWALREDNPFVGPIPWHKIAIANYEFGGWL